MNFIHNTTLFLICFLSIDTKHCCPPYFFHLCNIPTSVHHHQAKMAFVSKMTFRPFSLFSTALQSNSTIKEFVVIGGGQMGSGIAQVGAQTGHQVTLVDVSEDVLQKSQARINESIKRVAKKKFKDDSNAGEKVVLIYFHTSLQFTLPIQ